MWCLTIHGLNLRIGILLGSFLLVLVMGCSGSSDPSPIPGSTAVAAVTPKATINMDREIARGKRLAQQNACLGCHTTDGRDQVGPSWLGLYGATEEIEGGASVEVGTEYLAESIRNPNAVIVKGYRPDVMPPSSLNDDEINAVIAYIRSLQ